MGLIGDLLYPDNPELAREANAKQQTLEQTNALHNDTVNVYKQLAEEVRTFDGYLMAIMVMQYHLVFTAEDLEDLPPTKIPRLTKLLADKIESVALDAVSIKMGISGLKAMGKRVANIVREAGSYSDTVAEGPEAVESELASEIESVSAQADLVQSGNVEILTATDMEVTELGELADELGNLVEDVQTVTEAVEGGEELGELGELAESAATGVEAVGEAVEGTEAAAEIAAEAGVGAGSTLLAGVTAGISVVLTVAVVVVIVVTEVLSAIEAGEEHAKLEKALKHLDQLQHVSDKSLKTLKKAFKSLLGAARADVRTYNRILTRLYQLEKKASYHRTFGTDGIDKFIAAVDGINVGDSDGLAAYKTSVSDDLTPATDFIRKQAIHDAEMTKSISLMKSHCRINGSDAVDEVFLRTLADVEGIDLDRLRTFNTFRQYLAEFAAVLKPLHEQVRKQTPVTSGKPVYPKDPEFGEPDPKFDPRPGDFRIPAPAKA